jgi:hypothetical protein
MDDFHRFVGATQKDAMFPHDLADAHAMDGFERGEKGMQVFCGAAGGIDFVAVVGLYEYPLPVGVGGEGFFQGVEEGFHEADTPGEVAGEEPAGSRQALRPGDKGLLLIFPAGGAGHQRLPATEGAPNYRLYLAGMRKIYHHIGGKAFPVYVFYSADLAGEGVALLRSEGSQELAHSSPPHQK